MPAKEEKTKTLSLLLLIGADLKHVVKEGPEAKAAEKVLKEELALFLKGQPLRVESLKRSLTHLSKSRQKL